MENPRKEIARQVPQFIQTEGSASAPGSVEVLRQLASILQSRNFRNAGRLQKLLRFLVEETLQGRGGDLNISTLALKVFNKGPGFDNSEDAIVRVAANRLRKALDLHNATDGAKADIIIDLKPGNYQPGFSFRTTILLPARIGWWANIQVS